MDEEIKIIDMLDVTEDGELKDTVEVAVYGREEGMRAVYKGRLFGPYDGAVAFDRWEGQAPTTSPAPGVRAEWSTHYAHTRSLKAPGSACLARVRKELETWGYGEALLTHAIRLARANLDACERWREARARHLATIEDEQLLRGYGGLAGAIAYLDDGEYFHEKWMRLRYLRQSYRMIGAGRHMPLDDPNEE